MKWLTLCWSVLLASCGPIDFETPSLLNGCVKATPEVRSAFPGWRSELEIAAENANVDVYPSDNPACLNALDVSSEGFTGEGVVRSEGSLKTRFRIFFNTATLHLLVESSDPCELQIWLNVVIERQLLGLGADLDPEYLPFCGPCDQRTATAGAVGGEFDWGAAQQLPQTHRATESQCSVRHGANTVSIELSP